MRMHKQTLMQFMWTRACVHTQSQTLKHWWHESKCQLMEPSGRRHNVCWGGCTVAQLHNHSWSAWQRSALGGRPKDRCSLVFHNTSMLSRIGIKNYPSNVPHSNSGIFRNLQRLTLPFPNPLCPYIWVCKHQESSADVSRFILRDCCSNKAALQWH